MHIIYTLETGTSFRAGGQWPPADRTLTCPFAYYNRLATRLIAERDGVTAQVYAYDARNLDAVKLHTTIGNGL